MIYVVVGTQEPFDRLIRSVDEWSRLSGHKDIIAQISNASYKPANFKYFDFIPADKFNELFMEADLIVGHAGMGTIISAMQYQKPIIVMPRLAKYKEHRNDHQVATANSFGQLGYVKSVFSHKELIEALNERHLLRPAPAISEHASNSLLQTIENFLTKNFIAV
jgi:UDP-N-acetylglucosamine transferase subunit ALG13